MDPGANPAVTADDTLVWAALRTIAAGQLMPPLTHAQQQSPLLDLLLPVCEPPAGDLPRVIGHLGQSLDACVATAGGDSYFVTGPANIVHLHRLRALCDAVIVGAGTVQADDPLLTVRHVEGVHPLRVVLDPARRLGAERRLFTDRTAPTLRVVADGCQGGQPAAVEELLVGRSEAGLDLAHLLRALKARGCRRVLVEGGGFTVAAFVAAGLLDRLHIAVAPLLIGQGRPALPLPVREPLAACLRPGTRVFGMGADVLWDCDLRAPASPQDQRLRRLR